MPSLLKKLLSLLLACPFPAMISCLKAANDSVHPQGLDANPARTTSSPKRADHPTSEANEPRRSLMPV